VTRHPVGRTSARRYGHHPPGHPPRTAANPAARPGHPGPARARPPQRPMKIVSLAEPARPQPAKGSRPRRSAAVACTNSLHPVKQPAAPPAGPLAHGPAPNPVNPAAPSRRPTLTTGRCGGDRARTGALLRAKQALSQLSYTPIRPTPARPHRSRPIPRGPTRTGQSAPARRRSSVFPAGGPGRI
jgi:hypothetical protein